MDFQLKPVMYLENFHALAKLPDGRILGQNRNTDLNLYTVDMHGRKTLLFQTGVGFTKGVVLPSGTLLLLGGNKNIYRSNTLNYNSFTIVHKLRTDVSIIDRGWDLSPDGSLMYAEYSTSGSVTPSGERLSPPDQKIWRATDDGRVWEDIFTVPRSPQFEGDTDYIRHIHTIAYDKFSGKWYFSTGDGYGDDGIMSNTHEVKLYEVINGNPPTIRKIYDGVNDTPEVSQQWRSVSMIFTPRYIIWGADTPDVQAYYSRYDKVTGVRDQRTAVSGSVFITDKFQTSWGEIFIGNTAVESGGAGVWDDYTRLYISDDGSGEEWYEGYKWQKNPNHGAFARMTEMLDMGSNRMIVNIQNILDETGKAYVYNNAAIMTITSTEKKLVDSGEVFVNANGKIKKGLLVVNTGGIIRTGKLFV